MGCRVMLVWNKSEKLKNGTAGVFVEMEDKKMVVDLEVDVEVEIVKIEKYGRHCHALERR